MPHDERRNSTGDQFRADCAGVADDGRALGVSRNSAYNGANNGDIPTIDIGNRKRVPTSWLREKLGLN